MPIAQDTSTDPRPLSSSRTSSSRASSRRGWWRPAAVLAVAATALGWTATRGPAATEDPQLRNGPVAVVDPHAAATDDVVEGIEARAYAVFDPSTGEFLASRDLHGKRSVGSLMKLLTAYVVIRAGEPERVVTVPSVPLRSDESTIGLVEGERQRRDVLLRAMLIVSANDAARALAIDLAGDLDAFADRMNAAAAELGLEETRAVDPAGLDRSDQYSSAHDIVKLGSALMDDAEFRSIVVRREAHLHGDVHAATNDLLGTYAGADGIKTGHTDDAGWCLLASATRDGRRLIAVVLGAPDEDARDRAAARLLDWGFATG